MVGFLVRFCFVSGFCLFVLGVVFLFHIRLYDCRDTNKNISNDFVVSGNIEPVLLRNSGSSLTGASCC